MSTRVNPELLRRAFDGLQKVAFVSAQQQPQQAAAPGMDPAAAAAAGGGGAPPAAPADPAAAAQQAAPQPDPAAAQQQQQAAQQQQPLTPDAARAVMREELQLHEEKPKKLSVDERLTQLEGLILRMMEHDGKVKPDQTLLQQSQQAANGIQQQQSMQPAQAAAPAGAAGATPAAPPPPPDMAAAAGNPAAVKTAGLRGLLKVAATANQLAASNDLVGAVSAIAAARP